MPYTEDFNKIRRHFGNLYSDKAKAETFAFEEASKKGIETFTDRRPRQKVLKEPFEIDMDI